MHTVELLEEAFRVAEFLGFDVRHEWLGGGTGGACEFAGRKWLFVDLALNASEQLEQVTEALRCDPGVYTARMSSQMEYLLDIRRAA